MGWCLDSLAGGTGFDGVSHFLSLRRAGGEDAEAASTPARPCCRSHCGRLCHDAASSCGMADGRAQPESRYGGRQMGRVRVADRLRAQGGHACARLARSWSRRGRYMRGSDEREAAVRPCECTSLRVGKRRFYLAALRRAAPVLLLLVLLALSSASAVHGSVHVFGLPTLNNFTSRAISPTVHTCPPPRPPSLPPSRACESDGIAV